ncbi:hypothetical protein K7X08_033482 [Anisodus acutangulus]|uniref:O-fucosyltransferase family protein n=1 Tax=Anisodus acutangulus TaxID=402998 RepID=A0A9Q1M2Q5_9SOLA|nr:hypothetical protein K7X08_033482 [Anisodus acutangulus]
MLSRIQQNSGRAPRVEFRFLKDNSSTLSIREELVRLGKGRKPQKTIYARLLAKAAHAFAEGQKKSEPKDLWAEPYFVASSCKPCTEPRDWQPSEGRNGYIIVAANGGINQQRVAVFNIVAIARLLNATLVLPKFLYSSVWKDASQFGDIYQEEHFIDYLKPDIHVVRELPLELQSLDLEAIGSLVTDADVVKEAKPSFYKKYILPILHENRVVHFLGFGNRLASDPLPLQVQRLRCRCNFHALKFVPKIEETGALLIRRMRQNVTRLGPLGRHLVGSFSKSMMKGERNHGTKVARYLGLHLRFEIDMVAHSLCEYDGGEEERNELEAYREIHFPALVELKKTKKDGANAAALGFNRQTCIYLAGAHIYGGKSRLASFSTLYPNLVTKENLLSSSEIEPFKNFSSQLAALYFIVCTASDVFAMTDSGSQFSSLVSGFKYTTAGENGCHTAKQTETCCKFVKNNTIDWRTFEQRVRKAARQTKQVFSRPVGRSVYRYPRCKECMCNT